MRLGGVSVNSTTWSAVQFSPQRQRSVKLPLWPRQWSHRTVAVTHSEHKHVSQCDVFQESGYSHEAFSSLLSLFFSDVLSD